jgi:hypothetical protein
MTPRPLVPAAPPRSEKTGSRDGGVTRSANIGSSPTLAPAAQTPADVVWRQGFALALGLPEDAPEAVELARAAAGLAEWGRLVMAYGHGHVELQFRHGRYVRPSAHLVGPEVRDP